MKVEQSSATTLGQRSDIYNSKNYFQDGSKTDPYNEILLDIKISGLEEH